MGFFNYLTMQFQSIVNKFIACSLFFAGLGGYGNDLIQLFEDIIVKPTVRDPGKI